MKIILKDNNPKGIPERVQEIRFKEYDREDDQLWVYVSSPDSRIQMPLDKTQIQNLIDWLTLQIK